MKVTIKETVDVTKVNTREVEVDLPESAVYLGKGMHYPYSSELFAIVPQKDGSPHNYNIVKVTSNRQEYNDFVPTDDCDSEFWMKESLRRDALKIIKELDKLRDHSNDYMWKVITEEEFKTKREWLINRAFNGE